MTTRFVLVCLLGALAMFLWTFVAHMVLPLGETGIREIANEQPVLAAMQTALGPNAGLYMFPGMGLGPHPTRQQQNDAMPQYMKQFAGKPSGLLLYHPAGREFSMGPMLVKEFLTELAEVFLALLLVTQTRLASFLSRVFFVTLLGVLAAIATNVSYWTWYGFPGDYTLAYMTTQAVGFFCAGIVIAAGLRKKPRPA